MKRFSVWAILCLYGLCNIHPAKVSAQSATFPEIRIKKKGELVAQRLWNPSALFLKENPDFLKYGTYRFSQSGLSNINSQNYKASLVKGSKIDLQNVRLIICFPVSSLKSPNAEAEKYFSPIPLGQYDIYSDTALYNHTVDVLDNYNKLNQDYREQVFRSLSDKYSGDIKVLPIGSQYLNGFRLKIKDFFLELNYDGKYRMPAEEDYAYLYTLKVRDCSGKVLRKFGQAVFVTESEQMLKELSFIKITNIAINNLINQFSEAKMEIDISTRLNSLKIKYVDDSNFIRRFVYMNLANYYHLAQKNIIFQLQAINNRITVLGGTGLDLSTLNMPINAGADPSANLTGATVVAGAELAASVINSVNITKLNNLKSAAEEEINTLNHFKYEEQIAVNNYNRLIGWRGNNIARTYGNSSNTYSYSNHGSAKKQYTAQKQQVSGNVWDETENTGNHSNRNTRSPNSSSADVWSENNESSSSQSHNHTKRTGNDNVWADNEQSSGSSGQQEQAAYTPLQIASDNVQQEAEQYSNQINQNATQSINQLQATNQANINTMQNTVNSVSAAETAGGNTAGSQGSSSNQDLMTSDCQKCSNNVKRENDIDINTYKNKGMNATLEDGLVLKRKCTQRYLDECDQCLSPKDKALFTKIIQDLTNQINQMDATPRVNFHK